MFVSFPKRFTPAVFKNKYRHEVIKTCSIEAPVLWETTVPARFSKIRGKTSTVEFDFSKAVGKNSGAVHEHKHGTFSECFLENFTKVFRTV